MLYPDLIKFSYLPTNNMKNHVKEKIIHFNFIFAKMCSKLLKENNPNYEIR